MRSDTPLSAIFVSCDIVGHAETDDHDAQLARIRGLNESIKKICGMHFPKSAIWASGGDGGHVAFLDPALAPIAVQLLESLFIWADGNGCSQEDHKVQLRLTAHYGPVTVIEGGLNGYGHRRGTRRSPSPTTA